MSHKKKERKFKLDNDAVDLLKKANIPPKSVTAEEQKSVSDKHLKALIAFAETEGVGFNGKDTAYAYKFVFLCKQGMPIIDAIPFLGTEEEVEAKHADYSQTLLNYHRYTNNDIVGIIQPTVERIYKH